MSFFPHTWEKANGRRILVQHMTTAHINNCIACWNGNGNMEIPEGYLGGKEKWLRIFTEELTRRQ